MIAFHFEQDMVYLYTDHERQVSGMPYSIEELQHIINPIARKHGVKSVSLFGSYANGSATVDSDVDLKIEKGQLKTLFQLCDFRLAVEDALHLPVDLITEETSDISFLDLIEKEEVLLYRNTIPSSL